MPTGYPTQPLETDSSISRTSDAYRLDSRYFPVPFNISRQRILSNWHAASTYPLDLPYSNSSDPQLTPSMVSYISNNDGPWSPEEFGSVNPPINGGLHPRDQQLQLAPGNQSSYCSRLQAGGHLSGASGILGKSQSDSGYGSLRSTYAPSTSNYEAGTTALGYRHGFTQGLHQTDTKPTLVLERISSEASVAVSSLLHCPTCNKTVRTPSALRYVLRNETEKPH